MSGGGVGSRVWVWGCRVRCRGGGGVWVCELGPSAWDRRVGGEGGVLGVGVVRTRVSVGMR